MEVLKPKRRKEVKRSPNSRFVDIEKIWEAKQQSNGQEIVDIASDPSEVPTVESDCIEVVIRGRISSDDEDE